MKPKNIQKLVDKWIAFYENKWSENRTEKATELLAQTEQSTKNIILLKDKSAEIAALRIIARRVY